LGNFTTTAIITKGLHCGPACQGIITGKFSLYCTTVPVIPPQTGGGGGGGYYPGPAWNKFDSAQDIYQPVDQDVIIPWEQYPDPFNKKLIVTLTIDIGGIHVEKIYTITERRKQAVVKIFNMLNATQSRMSVTIAKLKRVATNAKAFINKLKLK